ncbi:MAG: DUF3592 domain-containing protein [Rhodothermales bacterium]
METVSVPFMSLFKIGSKVKFVARLMWALPALLCVISVALFRAGLAERQTLDAGTTMTAQVVHVEFRNRADVTYGDIDLRIRMSDTEVLERRLPLPLSLLTPLRDRKEVTVRVLPGTSKDVVIEEIARAQWRMALIQSAMSALGAILLIIAVAAWNRYLNREGDPAERAS